MQGGSILGHKNESLVDEWLTDDRLMLLECWARDGIKMSEMAERIGISNSMFVEWRKEYPEIGNAVKNGKEIVDYKVENALLKAALGYTTKEIKVTIGKQQKNGKTFMITKETTEKAKAKKNKTAKKNSVSVKLEQKKTDKKSSKKTKNTPRGRSFAPSFAFRGDFL